MFVTERDDVGGVTSIYIMDADGDPEAFVVTPGSKSFWTEWNN